MKKLQLLILFAFFSIVMHGQITTDFSANNTIGCEVASVDFTDQSSSNGTITTWLWDFGNGITSTQQNPSINYLAVGTYTVCLTVTDDLGQNSMLCQEDFIVVNASPVASIDPNIPLMACGNSNVTLDAGLSSQGANITYSWSTVNGNILFGSENAMNPIVGATGIYTLVVTNTSTACTSVTSVQVEGESDFPVAVVQTPSLLSCNNPTVTLDGTGSSPSPDYVYEWSANGFSFSNDLIVEVDAAGVYELEVRSAAMSWCKVVNQVEVFEDGTGPTIHLPIIELNDTIYNCQEVIHYSADLLDADCLNCAVEIRDANDTLICDALPCVYDLGDFIGNGYFPQYPFSIFVTDNGNGCTNAALLPQPPSVGIFTSLTKTNESCAGSADGSIDLSVSGTTAPFTFDWEDLPGTNDSLDRENLSAGTYTLNFTDAFGCTYGPNVYEIGISNGTQIDAVIAPVPTLSCVVAAVTLDASNSTSSSGGALTYEWSLNGVFIGMGVSENVSEGGTYDLIVTDTGNGCSATASIFVEEDITPPVADAGPDQTLDCNTPSITLDATGSSSGPNIVYSWYDANGIEISNMINLTVTVPGIYTLEVTNIENGCNATDDVTITANLDIPTISVITPTVLLCGGDMAGLELSTPCVNCSIEVLDAMGNIVCYSSGSCEVNPEDGPFQIIVTDLSNGCFSTENFTLVTADPIEISSVVITNASCNENDGSINISISGGVGPYTFTWSNGITPPILGGLAEGIYNVTITDANGCFIVSPDYVVDRNFCVELAGNETICLGDTIDLLIELSGVDPSYSYTWSPSNSFVNTNTVSPTETTTYIFTILDAAGMPIFVETTTITVQNYMDFNLLDFSNAPLCDGDTLELYANMGTTFLWTGPNGFTSTLENPILNDVGLSQSGIYILDITDDFGCSVTADVEVFIDEDCVWPGDTDTNRVVNHFDLLNIGLAFDSTGTTRQNASFDWIGQPSFDWSQSTPNSNVNFKHIDADGNGVIDAQDTMAITQNFGETHNFTAPVIFTQFTELPPVSDGTLLTTPFYVAPDTLIEGATISLDIILGDVSNVVVGLYGIAFSLEYDTAVVVAESASIDFSNSWLGDIDADAISVQFDFPNSGRIDAAITRIDGAEMDGFGLFGEFIITLEDDILLWDPNRNNALTETTTEVTADFSITNYHLINFSQEEILVEGLTTSSIVEETTSLSQVELNELIEIYPNPVEEVFFVAAQNLELEKIRIYALTGELKKEIDGGKKRMEIGVKDFASGVYFVEILTREGIVTKKVIVR